jgi:hypothetical protein
LGFFLNFLMDLGSVWFGFFMFGFFFLGSVFQFQAYETKTETESNIFFKYSNRFFFLIRFFRLLFFLIFSVFQVFLTHS